MDIASFAISCLAAVAAAAAVWYGRGQKRAADRSAAEAKRSADAAAEMTEIERARRADEVSDADRRRVRFELMHEGGHAYLLRNAGSDAAYGVRVDTGGLGTVGEVEEFDEFESGREHRYLLSRTIDPDEAEHVVVTWHHRPDRSDERRTVKLLGP
ncbi:hypothetical protein [Amycolatopsis nalaikhensis]|uniref:Secreted protein n=1 Tax=Amycolatopsis nalaikhensis TaxID=715472 RepID=A0ABY8XBD6_9PSEU|nr:hypothetical protein [Amycolatopsis sp. 2-2]WIV52851.1 hypothetical protein QP939_28320 [Amycolatopsis sp. 2-2]